MDVSIGLSNITGSKEYERSQNAGFSTRFSSFEAVKEANRMYRYYLAQQFLMGCTFDTVLKTCVLSPGTYSWFDKSYGITWVGVHGVGDSICVVTGRNDLVNARVSRFNKILPEYRVMYRLPEAILSGIEGLPYDDEFCKRTGLSIKKPFGVGMLVGPLSLTRSKCFPLILAFLVHAVSVIPVTRKSDEETGQLALSLEYDENKAINFLKEKMKSESAITSDETIKTAISAFQHLCLQELKAEDFWVTTWNGGETDYLPVNEIEEHLAAINGGSGSGGGSTNNDEIMEDLGVINSGYGSSDLTNKVIKGISSLKVHNNEILI